MFNLKYRHHYSSGAIIHLIRESKRKLSRISMQNVENSASGKFETFGTFGIRLKIENYDAINE